MRRRVKAKGGKCEWAVESRQDEMQEEPGEGAGKMIKRSRCVEEGG